MKEKLKKFIYDIVKKALYDTDYDHEKIVLRNTRHIAILILELQKGTISKSTEQWLTSINIEYMGFNGDKSKYLQ